MGIAVGRLDFHHVVAHFQDGDIKGAAAEIIHGDALILLFIKAIGQGRCGGLVDDAQHVEAGNGPGILGGLPLAVVKIGGHGNDRILDLGAEIGLSRLFQLLQDLGGDFRRRILLPHYVDAGIAVAGPHHLVGNHLHLLVDLVILPSHEPLDGKNGILRVGNRLPFGHLPDQNLAILGERHH